MYVYVIPYALSIQFPNLTLASEQFFHPKNSKTARDYFSVLEVRKLFHFNCPTNKTLHKLCMIRTCLDQNMYNNLS